MGHTRGRFGPLTDFCPVGRMTGVKANFAYPARGYIRGSVTNNHNDKSKSTPTSRWQNLRLKPRSYPEKTGANHKAHIHLPGLSQPRFASLSSHRHVSRASQGTAGRAKRQLPPHGAS
eukprot:5439058-Prymnesium_polylepis.1